jgi:hypothetical protein
MEGEKLERKCKTEHKGKSRRTWRNAKKADIMKIKSDEERCKAARNKSANKDRLIDKE